VHERDARGALRQRKAAQAADRLKAREAWQDTGHVFTTTTWWAQLGSNQ
jgi:hypothetical protein